MANFLTKAISSFGGGKMSDPRKLHDPEEYKKWKDRAEKSYGRYGKRRDHYEGRAKDEYSRYGKSMSEADRLYGRAESTYGAADAAIGDAAFREKRAGELADDRQHYAGLGERAKDRRKARESYRLELESMGAPPPGSFDAVQAMVMDAAKEANDAAMVQTSAIAANLGKTNPVAAAKLMMDAQNSAGSNMAKAKQKGWFAGKENFMNDMTAKINNITAQAGMLTDDETADQLTNAIHSNRINEQLNLSSSALNRAGVTQRQAEGFGGLGDRFDRRAGRSLEASMGYDDRGDLTSDKMTSMEEQEKGYQRDLLQSDAIAQQQVDEYNQGAFTRGLANVTTAIDAGAKLYSGWKAGEALTNMYGSGMSESASPSLSSSDGSVRRVSLDGQPGPHSAVTEQDPRMAMHRGGSRLQRPMGLDRAGDTINAPQALASHRPLSSYNADYSDMGNRFGRGRHGSAMTFRGGDRSGYTGGSWGTIGMKRRGEWAPGQEWASQRSETQMRGNIVPRRAVNMGVHASMPKNW